jgi:hypothetical protein
MAMDNRGQYCQLFNDNIMTLHTLELDIDHSFIFVALTYTLESFCFFHITFSIQKLFPTRVPV